jgi:hypothetical protein
MYMTVRQMQADIGRMEDAVSFAGYVAHKLNTDHGADMRASVNIGGDPSAIALSGRWETLGQYGEMRAALMADAELQSAIRVGSALFTHAADAIGRAIKPAGEPGPIAVVNSANMHMPRVGEAVTFALEVAEVVESLTGNAAGVITSVTGDRSQLWWIGFSDSLDDIGEQGEKLESSEEYLALFKRSEELFVPGSLAQSFWQFVA